MDVDRMRVEQNGVYWQIIYHREEDGKYLRILECNCLTDALDAWVYLYNQNRHLPGVDATPTWPDLEEAAS